MERVVLSPSKARPSPPERTLILLHEKLDEAEIEAKKLSEHLSSYGFSPAVATPNDSGKPRSIETITPYDAGKNAVGNYDALKKNYEDLVRRVCRVESTVHSLKLALVSLEAEYTLMTRDKTVGTLNANEAFEKELMKLKKDLAKTLKSLEESEGFRAKTEDDFQKLRNILDCKSISNTKVVKKVQEMSIVHEKLTKQVDELSQARRNEKNLCTKLEDSHSDLLSRVAEMERLVERENHEMKILSGDCTKLKKELQETRCQYNREYQTRMQLETLMDRLRQDADNMESKLLVISNERKSLDVNLTKLKHENKEMKQQLDFTLQSNETLKAVNLDLEKRYKEAREALRKIDEDNKILLSKHRDSIEKERKELRAKLQQQDKLLDEAKESILQEMRREKEKTEEKDIEIASLKHGQESQEKILHEKDKELSRVKEVLETLTTHHEKMIEENNKISAEIKRNVEKNISEKSYLTSELDERKVENNSLRNQNKVLTEQCETLQSRINELQQQQTNHARINATLESMVEDKRRLAYENGVLLTEKEKLLVNETTMKKNMHELRNSVANKMKETEILIKQRDEALKTAERLMGESEDYERKCYKKINTLHSTVAQSKEDNKKLAGTLDAVMTSHNQLQALCEKLQKELGKRDSRLTHLEKERSETEERITALNNHVESLKSRVNEKHNVASDELNTKRNALQLLERDREKLFNTVEPLMKTNKDLQESLEGMANELKKKNNEIKKLRASSVNVKREMEVEAVTMETKVDNVRKEYDVEMKEIRKQHKKEISQLRHDFQEMMKLKNSLKEENTSLRKEKDEMDDKMKKLRERLKERKREIEDCVRRQTEKEEELNIAQDKILAMNRELAMFEKLKIEYTENNIEQARSLQEFVSQLTELQHEFRTLAQAQYQTSLLCRQKDVKIRREKERRREAEIINHGLRCREKNQKVKQDMTELQLEEVNYESQQVAVNLQEAHDWFQNKFINLQSELKKSRKIQTMLEQENVDHYKALHDERRRADEATERAKDIIKSSREMISKLVGQVTSTAQKDNIDFSVRRMTTPLQIRVQSHDVSSN